MRRPVSRSSEVAGVVRSGIKAALVDVDADADDGKCDRGALGVRLHQDAAGLARALVRTQEQIVGPAQIDVEAGDGANGIGGGKSRGQRQAAAGERREWAGAAARSRKAPRPAAERQA